MNIVRFCGSGTSDIHCVLTQDNWELGMPEGLAHWNGTSWRWLGRMQGGFVQEIKRIPRGLLWLDADGSITTFDNAGKQSTIRGPAYDLSVHAQAGTSAPSFYSFAPIKEASFVVVGDYGLLYIYREGNWRRVPTATDQRLNHVVAYPSCCYVAGMNGALFRLEMERLEALSIGHHESVLRIDTGFDGSTYLLVNSSDHFAFSRFDGRIIDTFPVGREPMTMSVVEENRIIYSSYDGVFLWCGQNSEQRLLADLSGQIEHIDNLIAVSVKRASNASILFDHRNWHVLQVNLDETFLE